MHSMDWDDLRIFLALARSGRLLRAAKTLGVEHTTVSRRLTALEAAVGVPLFYRTSGGYLLTPHGQNILASAEAMERAALAATPRARERSAEVAGRVRVALPPEFASHWLMAKLGEFRKRYPRVVLQVLVGTRERDLSRGEAEIAIQTPRPKQQALVAVRIARTSAALYVSRNMPGAPRRVTAIEDLGGRPLLVYSTPFQLLQDAKWFQPLLASAPIGLETNSTHALLAAARAGAGIAVLPAFVARQYKDLALVSESLADHDVWLTTHPEFRRDPKVRVTADFLKRAASSLV